MSETIYQALYAQDQVYAMIAELLGEERIDDDE